MSSSRIHKRADRDQKIAVRTAVLDFLASPEVRRLRPKTQAEYEHNLLEFAGWCASHSLVQDRASRSWKAVELSNRYPTSVWLHLVDNQVVALFLEHLGETHKPKRGKQELSSYTFGQYVKGIKRFLTWCCTDEQYQYQVSAAMVMRIKNPRVEEAARSAYSSQEIEALFKACEREAYEHLRVRDRAILAVLLDSGLRATELCTLSLGNVNLDAKDAYVRVRGKGGKWGEVGLGEQARRAIQKYLRQFRFPTLEHEIAQVVRGLPERQARQRRQQMMQQAYLFMNRAGKPLTRGGLLQIIKRLAQWAEVPNAFPHRFRHTFAVLFWRKTKDIRTLSKLLRHSSLSVTERYLESIVQAEARHGAPSVLDELL